MNERLSFKGISAAAMVMIVAVTNVGACPDCALKSSGGFIEPQTVMSKLAFSSSTLLLLGILCSVLGFLIWSMVKTCRELNKERSLSSIDGV
ncbi:MAG: hypothetical protein WCP60_05230 [bacterium]